DAVRKLHAEFGRWMQQYSECLQTLAMAATEKILRRKLETEQDLLTKWVSEAVSSTRSSAALIVAVHPETIAELGEALDRVLASPDLPEQTHLEPDESVQPGDVVVRQAGGEIHAGLNAQLDRLGELLK
ncbi:MAG: FliH/SctL family protein, partial [Planctomycetota bacterium]